ncbi:cation acetate symporter [Nitratireductor aquimarinus]|uniref:sodium:solute symporter family protein n=1 Tax=Alphaproteobacteria TaxID=28211 RepID=UPI000DDD0ACC|nr:MULTISPECIES: sodium:solute symporter family protein [Alphaproteobacteria]MBY6021084.1 cation acetate symporter [Nitratireductor sp. DP7N14-4]MBN7756298.1 cation acetate symporter [Nitratireductor aquimarinus]MBN7759883.1 cation acetate symporter [Nitratireductor aquibiodomus]MBN7776685.1 cation acetate symporter [Nitratireductor pacificus]MBN7780019.1 cation acetate symporter [Nitratireductor pacificus]
MALLQGRFIDNIGRVYTLYTGGFLAFILLMALLEQFGVGADTIGILFVAFTIGIYALIGWLSRTMEVDAYYVAGRQVPAVYNGMATAADWMSGASFVALAGGVYFGGYGYMAFIVGWTGGYVLVNSLMAPYLRKFGCYTVPDFIGTRYGGNLARLCAVIVLVVASFTYVTAQINATGTIAARALHIPFSWGVWFGLLGILLCSMLGGMRAVTWTQVAQYIVLIVAYLVPVIWMSNVQGFGLIPHFTYGDAASTMAQLEAQFGLNPPAEAIPGLSVLTTPHTGPVGDYAEWRFITLALVMMCGTASLPHILMRYFTTPTVRAARKSVAWSLLFIFLLYFTAPALATLTKLQLLDPSLPTAIIGKPFEEVASLAWIQNWASVGFLAIADQNGDGILQLNEFFMRPDIVVLATPEIAGLPYVISGLVAAGGMAAAMSTADGLLLAIANALSHDLYYKMIDPKADTAVRLVVARILLLGIGALAALIASLQLTGILGAVAWAFCFAASGLFFPLCLGVWWKRANRAGAVAGMAAGFTAGTLYLYYVYTGGTPWFGLDHLRFGIVGMAVSLVSMVVVTLLTPAPDEEIQRMVEETRVPTGPSILSDQH